MYKALFFASLILGSIACEFNNDEEYESLINGFLEGLNTDYKFGDINKCIDDVANFAKDINVAVQDFKSGGINNILAGVKELTVAAGIIPDAIQDCSSVSMVAVYKALNRIGNPSDVNYMRGGQFEIIELEGLDVSDFIRSAVFNWYKCNFAGAGQDFGRMIYEATSLQQVK